MLALKNGFYAFESALHVFPAQSCDQHIGLDLWNSETLWRSAYGEVTNGCGFFAEDIFGGQFCFKEGMVYFFDSESGDLEPRFESIDEWAREILNDYENLTGYPFAHEWQVVNGPISPGMRLGPKIPFVAGGEYSIQNLFLIAGDNLMRTLGDFATQIKDLPDGSSVRLKVQP